MDFIVEEGRAGVISFFSGQYRFGEGEGGRVLRCRDDEKSERQLLFWLRVG